MTVREIEDGAEYQVDSDSGNTYTVRYAGCGDGDPEYIALWDCDCPAGKHGRHCKHVNAVGAFIDAAKAEDAEQALRDAGWTNVSSREV